MEVIKITNTQMNVMKMLRGGWKALQNRGTNVEINGSKVCTQSTMDALQKLGLVVKEDKYYWAATPLAKEVILESPKLRLE